MLTLPNFGTANLFQQNSDALYLFAPSRTMRLANIAHRPLQYSFTEDFSLGVSTAIEQSYARRDKAVLSNLLRNPIASSAALPSNAPDSIINLDPMADVWRFALILNNPAPQGLAVPSSALTNNRVIVLGWFTEEPINQLTMFSGAPTINPNAAAIVTHKTVVESMSSIGPAGQSFNRINTRHDAQIIQPDAVSSMSSTPDLCYIDPGSLQNASTRSGNMSMAFPAEITNGIKMAPGGRAIDAKLQVPQYNLMHVMSKTVDSYRDLVSEQTNGGAFAQADDFSVKGEVFEDILTQNMNAQPHNSAILGPKIDEMLLMSTIVQRYNPEIHPIIPEASTMFSALDASAINPVNIFSDLLCSSMPAIMARLGITTLVFRYQSYPEGLILNNTVNDDVLEIGHVETFVPMGGDVLTTRVDAVFDELRKGIFSIIKNSHGDFYLDMSVSTSGMAHAQLSFADSAGVTTSPFERPVCYDGLISTLVVSRNACMNNSSQYAALMNSIRSDHRVDAVAPNLLPAPIANYGPAQGPMGMPYQAHQTPPAPQHKTVNPTGHFPGVVDLT